MRATYAELIGLTVAGGLNMELHIQDPVETSLSSPSIPKLNRIKMIQKEFKKSTMEESFPSSVGK